MRGMHPKYIPLAAKSIQTSNHSVSWHRDAVKFHALSACILAALLVCVSLSAANGGVSRITELYSGQCSRAKAINQCIQLICAITAIGMSVSFDFFIRLVSSPTVEDLRKAHSRGHSLDVGVHSFRNLRRLSRWRMICWVLLVATGLPIQLLFHSSTVIVYTSTAYSIFMVSESFTTGAEFVYPGVAFMDHTAFNTTRDYWDETGFERTIEVRSLFDDILPGFRGASTNWTRLEVQDCLRTYVKDPRGLQSHRNVLLVVENRPDADAQGWKGAQVWNGTPPAYTSKTLGEYRPEAVNTLWSFSALCTADRTGNSGNEIGTFCKHSSTSWYGSEPWNMRSIHAGSGVPKVWNMTWKTSPYRNSDLVFGDGEIYPQYQTLAVRYCLSEPYSAPCKIFVSGPFLLISLLCVLLGSILSVVASSFHWRKETCQCLGDALKVFMVQNADISRIYDTGPTGWKDANKRLGRVVSRRMWLWTYIPIALFLMGGTACFFAFGSSSLKFDADFGDSLGNRLILLSYTGYKSDPLKTSAEKFFVYCLTANLPQIALSIYYFTFSSLYSTIFQGKYWADFAVKAQQLRVSSKHGAHQVSTHTFQFPLLWGIGFVSLKALLGWILTQTLYVVPIGGVSLWRPEFDFKDVNIHMGYSIRAMIPGLVIVAVTAALPVILSFRRLPMKSVIVGTDSAAIASYCPPNEISERQDEDFELQQDPGIRLDNLLRSRRDVGKLKWGVLDLGSERDQRPGVLGLGSEWEVINVSPVAGHRYIPVGLASDGVARSYRRQADGRRG